MSDTEKDMKEHRREFLEFLESEQPTEIPNKGRESHLKPGQRYKTHESTEDSPNG